MAYSARHWVAAPSYGEVFYERAIGKAPEMESSKAAARQLRGLITAKTRLLDVGCGAGHYLRSLRREFSAPFFYEGADITPQYIRLAKKAFADDPQASFRVASIGKLPYESKSFNIVLCCNILLHLPDIVKPIRELWRVTRETLLIRTYIGDTNLRIQRVPDPVTYKGVKDPLFKANGEPIADLPYYNIYSESYIRWLCGTLPGADNVVIQRDTDFAPSALSASKWPEKNKPNNLTEVINGQQVVHKHILQPWSFLRITRKQVHR